MNLNMAKPDFIGCCEASRCHSDAEREDYDESNKNGLFIQHQNVVKVCIFFMFEKQNIKTQAG